MAMRPSSFPLKRSFSAFLRSPESFSDGLLKSCRDLSSLQQIHSSLTISGIIKIPNFCIQIAVQYSKFGKPYNARSLFDGENSSSVWNLMIRAFANGGQFVETLELYSIMRSNGISRNNYTFPFALKACASRSLIEEGEMIHGDVVKTGFALDSYVERALLDTYIKCGEIDGARKVFDEMPVRDFICWTGIITAYRKANRPQEALGLYQKMVKDGVFVDAVAIVSAAAAVSQLGDFMKAEMVHAHVIRTGFTLDLHVGAALVAMYAKCGEIHHGRKVFDEMLIKDLVCWTGMITAYEQTEQPEEALVLFQEMQQNGVFADAVSIISVAAAVGQLGDIYNQSLTPSQELRNPSIRILYPTIDRVKNACSGIHPSKQILCFSEKTWQKLKTVDILHDSIPHPEDRIGHPMHTKVIRRRFWSKKGVSSSGWVYNGSHNFSAAAWGRPISSSRLHISNYEVGIVFVFPPTEKGGNLDDIVLPFVVPAPKYGPRDRPATPCSMRELLREVSAKERLVEAEKGEETMEEMLSEEDEDGEESCFVAEEKEDDKNYAEMLWIQVDSSQSS